MTNKMVSSGLWTMLYLTKFILTTDGPFGCVMTKNRCQSVWQQIYHAGPHTYPML